MRDLLDPDSEKCKEKKFLNPVASGPQIGYDGTMTSNQVSCKRFGHEDPTSLLQAAWIRMAAGG